MSSLHRSMGVLNADFSKTKSLPYPAYNLAQIASIADIDFIILFGV